MKKKVSLMVVLILVLQILLPMLTVIWESGFTIKSVAADTLETTVDGIVWTYTLDGENNAIDVKPKDKNSLPKEVTIPSTLDEHIVTSIGNSAFEECRRLTNITIPEGVTSIGSYAFMGCRRLTNITIPEGVTSIEKFAFHGCRSLTSITIPEGVTSIENFAFFNCSSLTNIEIPEGVTSIGNAAFYYCSSLTSITIPERVTSIGNSAFALCSSLTSINVNENNQNYSSVDGVLFDKDKTALIEYPAGKTDTEYVIPNSVTIIEDSAFIECSSLKSIEIPEGVTSIEDDAFRECSSLTSITIPEGVTSIGNAAFYYCSSLTSITIPERVTSIGNSAFDGCSSLTIYCRSNSYAKTYAETNSISYIIDDEAPTITSIEGNPEDWTKENVTLTINAEDALSGLATEAYSFDGGATWQVENTKTYEENTNDIVIKVRDNLGNIATQTVNITKIDKEAPTIASIEGNPEDWTKENVTLTINAEDALSGLATEAYSFDGGATWQVENTKTYEENTNDIVIKVRDNLGNIATQTVNITKIDKEAPTIASIEGNPEDWTKENVTLTINAEDTLSGLATEAYSFDGGATWQVENTKTYEENTNDIVIKVRDNIGNIATQTVNITKIITLTGITISQAPTKTDYIEGQTFDKTGMIITATYNNGSTAEITNYTVTPSGALTTNDNKVTISYTENNITKTAEQEITVTAKQEANPEPEKLLKGDVNGDGKVDFIDILLINEHRLNKAQLIGEYLEAADVNGDSKVDFMDILKINKYRLEKINSL